MLVGIGIVRKTRACACVLLLGTPAFVEHCAYPNNDNAEWKLLVQLASDSHVLQVSGSGTGFVFINRQGTQGKFVWQS